MTTKIAIDATSCAYAPMSGTGVYVRNVVSQMLELGEDAEFHLISSKACDLDWSGGAVTHFGKGELSRHNIAWWALSGNRILSKIGADVFWSPFQFFPIGVSLNRKNVLTVLDLVWHHMPSVMERRNYLLNKRMMKRSLKKASAIIAISNATRNDLLNSFDVEERDVRAIHLSASPEFRTASATELEETARRYPVCKGPFILAVGALEPRKNHLRLVRAVDKLRRSGNCDFNLIIAGSSGWNNEEFFDSVRRNGLNEWVHILRDVSISDLRGLYNMAKLLVFPSLMEGFGIPILEAMACGCPVVTSNISSMPEVAGTAAVLIDPNDVDSIATGIQTALGRRAELKKMGIERAKQFSWRESAKKHLDILLG